MSDNGIRGEGQQARLNVLDWLKYDPYLSQFKYHLILHRVHFPHLQYSQFANNLYRNFRANLAPNAIYIVQIVETYDHFMYDVAVGFRRDIDAINVYEKSRKIFISGKEVQIELAEAFKIYLDSRQANSNQKKSERRRRTPSNSSSSSSSSEYRRRKKESNKRSRSRSPSLSPSESRSYSDSRSRSRSRSSSVSHSRSHSRSQRRETFVACLHIPLVPYQWGKEYLQLKLCQVLKCPRYELAVDQKRGELSSAKVTVRSQTLYNDLLAGIRLGDHSLLFLRDEDVNANGIKPELRKYQFKAQRNEIASIQTAFDELAAFLLNFKDFHLKVVMISCLENSFLVTTQTKISSILKFLKLSGWRFQAVNFIPRLHPSLQDRWFQYLSMKGKSY